LGLVPFDAWATSLIGNPTRGEKAMPHHVARVTQAIAESPVSFEDALQVGFKRAVQTLRGITGLRVLEERVSVKDNQITNYRVRFEVIFLLED
jgi:flavin-binding protein dodecin